MGRGIAVRIALAALASAAVGLVILAVGVAVVGADVFTALMVEAGDSAEHARAMYDQSVTAVVVTAFALAALASIVLAVLLARMPARPLADVGAAARRVAEGDYAARVPREGPEELVSLADSFNQMAASLERQEAMRRDFIANAAHELRTPLTNLQGYLEALRDGVITADRATYESLTRRLTGWCGCRARSTRSPKATRRSARPTSRRSTSRRPSGWRSTWPSPRSSAPASGRAGAPGPAAGASQPRPAGPGAGQPALERGPLYAGRRHGHGPCRATARGPACLGHQHGRRDPSGRPRARVRSASIASRSRRDRARGGAGIGLAIVKQLIELGGGRVGAESGDGQTRVWFSLPG